MKQERDNSKKVKKMRFEKDYPDKRKRLNHKGKNHGRGRNEDRNDDDGNSYDDFYDFD